MLQPSSFQLHSATSIATLLNSVTSFILSHSNIGGQPGTKGWHTVSCARMALCRLTRRSSRRCCTSCSCACSSCCSLTAACSCRCSPCFPSVAACRSCLSVSASRAAASESDGPPRLPSACWRSCLCRLWRWACSCWSWACRVATWRHSSELRGDAGDPASCSSCAVNEKACQMLAGQCCQPAAAPVQLMRKQFRFWQAKVAQSKL